LSTETFELRIQGLANSGDGVGRLDNKVIFVPYALPGDLLEIEITKNKKTFARGKIVQILAPGPTRQEAPCPSFGVCGGCDWQHLSYTEQLLWKGRHLQETLAKVGGLKHVDIDAVVPCPNPFNYRNRIQGEVKHGKFSYHQKGSSKTVEISSCLIADPKINQRLEAGLGSIAAGKKEIAIVGEEVAILPVSSDRTTELGFRQVNDVMADKLTSWCLEVAQQSGDRLIVDLFCGRGTWTNLMALENPGAQVIGVDILPENIHAAKREAERMGLKNVTFIEGDVEDHLDQLALEDALCIVDPPRSGLAASVLKALTTQVCGQLIYISCHPASLARDLSHLVGPYALDSIRPLDMFPQTAHLETWVRLRGNQL